MTGCCCGQLAAVREALEPYTRHDSGCRYWQIVYPADDDCDCGLRAALSADSIGECPFCKGTGRFTGRVTDTLCAVCRGSGKVKGEAECPYKAEAERLRKALGRAHSWLPHPDLDGPDNEELRKIRAENNRLLADPPKERPARWHEGMRQVAGDH